MYYVSLYLIIELQISRGQSQVFKAIKLTSYCTIILTDHVQNVSIIPIAILDNEAVIEIHHDYSPIDFLVVKYFVKRELKMLLRQETYNLLQNVIRDVSGHIIDTSCRRMGKYDGSPGNLQSIPHCAR